MELGNALVWKSKELNTKWGFVCVRYGYTQSDRPERVILYWPCNAEPMYYGDAITMFPEIADGGDQKLYDHGQSNYSFTRSSGERVPIRLINGGQTQSIGGATIESVPAPKIRKGIEIRWYNGGWQKYLKSEGWVYA